MSKDILMTPEPFDEVRMYEEEIMTNDDNLESNLLTSNLLYMCSLVQAELCVYCCPVAGDELTLSVLCNLTLQVNLFSGNVIYWLPQFTQKYNGCSLTVTRAGVAGQECECLITHH